MHCRNPNFPDVKLAQAAVLCDTIAAFIKQQQQQQRQQQQEGSQDLFDMPVVIGGDFNSMWRKYTSDAWDKVG
jgi:mRNA deadenylase 3'-5' endonuclease subunit Ccr4